MKTKLITAVLTLAAVLLPAGVAGAVTSPVDGPSADILDQQTVDVDMAPDGTAALAYIKKVGGADHVFVSRFEGGAWTGPQRIDTGLDVDPSRNVSVAVANGGKIVVMFANGPAMNDARIYSVIRPAAGAPFGSPTGVLNDPAGKYADLELAPNGNGYAAVVVGVGANLQVYAYRLDGTNWSPVGESFPGDGGILDNDPNNPAGEPGDQRGARVAVAPDGSNAVVSFTEETGVGQYAVVARRVSGTTRGAAAVANVASFGGFNAADSGGDMADVDMDGSGTAWVVYRQAMEYTPGGNNPRCLARPLIGDTFGAAQLIDAFPTPLAGNACEFPRVDVNTAGQGVVAGYHQMPPHNVDASFLQGGTWSSPFKASITDNANPARTATAIGENGSGLIAWRHNPGGGADTKILARTTLGGGDELTLSNNSFGTAGGSGLEAAADNGQKAVVAFVQGAAATTRVVAAVVDLPQPPGPGPGPGGEGADTTRPNVTALRLSRKRFRLGRALPTVAAVKTGTVISFRIDEAATARLAFKRAVPGRRVGGKCRKPSRRNRGRKRCTRFVTVKGAAFSRPVAAGVRRIRFSGRISRRKSLKPGVYQLTLTARDAAGNVSTPDRARFTLLKAKPRKRR